MPHSPDPSPVLVVGCGLVGGSIAAGLSRAGLTVEGADRRDLSPLVERGWLARQVPADATAEAEVVVLALPPSGVVGALERLPWRAGQTVTDTASVKAPVARAAARLPAGVAFVGGHPMAGGTGSGFEAARPDLFRGARWVLLPGAPEAARRRVEELLRLLGAEPVAVEAELHDRLVARTSHLPQLLSTALAAELGELLDEPEDRIAAEALLGPGGRGFLRLAASPYPLWRDILALNGENVEAALRSVAARAGLPPDALEEEFDRARTLLARLQEARSGPS